MAKVKNASSEPKTLAEVFATEPDTHPADSGALPFEPDDSPAVAATRPTDPAPQEAAPVQAPVQAYRITKAVRFHSHLGIVTVAAGSVVSEHSHDLAVLRAAGAEWEAL